MPAYLCQSCDETFDARKVWDEHLNQEHSMHVSDFPNETR